MTAPIATNDFITAWMPLHPVGRGLARNTFFKSLEYVKYKVYKDTTKDISNSLLSSNRQGIRKVAVKAFEDHRGLWIVVWLCVGRMYRREPFDLPVANSQGCSSTGAGLENKNPTNLSNLKGMNDLMRQPWRTEPPTALHSAL